MILFNTPEFKVGILVVAIAGLIGVMSFKVASGSKIIGRGKEHSFIIENASGLVTNSTVRMAGIKVGIIDEILLKDGKAKIKIVIDKNVPLTISSSVQIRADGILGDKHVELVPGDPLDKALPPGSEILSIIDSGSMEQIMNEVGKIVNSLKRLSEDLTKSFDGQDGITSVGHILLNIEKMSKDLSELTGHNKIKINETIDEIHHVASTLGSFMSGDNLDRFQVSWQKAIDSLQRIDTSLENVEEITDKINRGGGTIGRLINDEETVDELNAAIRNVNNLVGGIGGMETSIDFHSEYLSEIDEVKSFLSVKIQPGLDRYYELGVVDDPRGLERLTATTTTVDSGTPSTSEQTKTFYNKVKINALFAKNFYNFTVKGGIFESSAGIGFDYYLSLIHI